jgi:hypothetical protein
VVTRNNLKEIFVCSKKYETVCLLGTLRLPDALPTLGNFSPLSSDVPLTQNSEVIFQENFPITIGETFFCQEPVLETMEQIVGVFTQN